MYTAVCLKGFFCTIPGAGRGGGVCPYIVSGVFGKSCEVAGEGARAGSVGGVAATDGGVVCRAPANTSGRDGRAGICCDRAATSGCRGGDVCDIGCCDGCKRSRCDGDGDCGVTRATKTVGARDCVGSAAGRIDGNAAARGPSAPSVGVGARSGERSAGTATDTGIATDGDCDGATARLEALFRAILGASSGGGVCPYIVSGALGKSCEVAGEGSCAGSIGGVASGDSGVVRRAPANTSGRDWRASIGCDCAPASGCRGGDVCDIGRCDGCKRGWCDGDRGRGVACASIVVGARDCVGSAAGWIDSDAAARGPGAPSVAVGARSGERGAGSATDTGIATDGDCGSGMDSQVQSIHLCAAVAVSVTIGVVAGRGVGVPVPGVAAALADSGGGASIVASPRYGYGSVGTCPATVAPYCPHSIVVIPIDSNIVSIMGGSGVGNNGAVVSVNLIAGQCQGSILNGGFQSKTATITVRPVTVGVPMTYPSFLGNVNIIEA